MLARSTPSGAARNSVVFSIVACALAAIGPRGMSSTLRRKTRRIAGWGR
jgi:hypothetical protein